MRYLLLIVLWIGLSLSTQSQNIFISSDGAIFMDMPTSWTIEETEIGVVHLLHMESGVDIQLTYGEPLYTQLLQYDPQLDIDTLTSIQTALTLSQGLDIEPSIYVETTYNRDVYQYAHDDTENGVQSFVMESLFTGMTHVIVSGSTTPYEDFLHVWLAYETPPEPPFDCSQLTLEASQALPGAILLVEGLTIGLSDFEFQAIADDIEDVMPLIAIAQEDASYVTAPLYPDLRLEGGDVTIQAIHNGFVCKEFPFVVEPMPEAPGELDRFIVAANRYIEATLSFLAIDRDDIMYAPVPDTLLPVAEVQFMLDHPDNLNSLANIIQTASADEIRFAEALFANDGYVDYFNDYADFLSEQPPLPPDGTAANELYLSAVFKPWQVNEYQILNRINIKTADDLSYYMRFQAFWANSGNALGKIGLGNSSTGLVVNALNKVGFVTDKVGARAGFAGAAISVGTMTASTMIDLYRHLLPSQFTRLRPKLSIRRFTEEDDDSTGKLNEVIVSATSLKWDLTKNIGDAVITIVGAAGAAKGMSGVAKVADAPALDSAYGTVDKLLDATAVADFNSNICGSDCNSDRVSVGPYTWDGIKLDVEKNKGLYINFQIDSRQSGLKPSIHIKNVIEYEARNDGLTVLRVRPKPAAFGGATFPKRVTITVDKIAVYVIAPQTAEPGKQVCASSTRVSHAKFKSLEWTLIDKTGIPVFEPVVTSDSQSRQFCFMMPTPSEEEGTTTQSYADCKSYNSAGYVVIAKSLTQKGAREHNFNEDRIGTAPIFIKGEDDICEGLWTVVAQDELNEFCVKNGTNQTDLQTIIDDLIASGQLNGVVNIEESDSGSYITITDKLTDQTQQFNRVNTEQNIEVVYGDVNIIGVGEGGTQIITITKPPSRPPKQYAKIYSVPLPPTITQHEPLTMLLTFTSSDTFEASLSWNVSIRENNVDVTCDIDFIYDGVLNKKADSK